MLVLAAVNAVLAVVVGFAAVGADEGEGWTPADSAVAWAIAALMALNAVTALYASGVLDA